MMSGFYWEAYQDIVLASEVVFKHPQNLVDWMVIAEALNKVFSTEEKLVQLKGQGCKEIMGLLLKKCKYEDRKALNIEMYVCMIHKLKFNA